MIKVENDLDIYYVAGNANTQDKKTNLQQLWKNVILQDGSWSQKVPQ